MQQSSKYCFQLNTNLKDIISLSKTSPDLFFFKNKHVLITEFHLLALKVCPFNEEDILKLLSSFLQKASS